MGGSRGQGKCRSSTMWRHRCNSSIFGGDRIIAETAFCDGASSASVSWQTVVCVMGSHFFLRLRRSRYLCQRSQRFPLSPSGCNGRGSFPKDSFFLQCHERTMFCFPFHCSYSFLLCFPTFPNRFTWCVGGPSFGKESCSGGRPLPSPLPLSPNCGRCVRGGYVQCTYKMPLQARRANVQ